MKTDTPKNYGGLPWLCPICLHEPCICRPNVTECCTITIGPRPCLHENGWFKTIPARWFGRREVYVCADCGAVLDAKTKTEV